ncbi:F0F1 ATP synthase subunit B family protein [Bombella saccharophila]|uniref:ATP synthase subunit b n=1 Tax=Bombella saccharophila TaxID=2967338 RepID=A0ABT3W7W1_9PROT|nr:hypothetical protein [Bombella saccharophila]MCX5614479.1 hypothetical protein [Bombella saccharophila]PHI96868.1 hypothetical protein BG621_03940 [Parasaccharibacter apium]
MRLTPRFLLSAAAPLAALPGRAVAEGMPQLHFNDPYVQGQVVWGAIIFFIFYLLLSRSALPRVANVLKARDQRIKSDLDLARRAKQNADQAQHELCEARDKAFDDAHAIIQEIRDSAKKNIQQQVHETMARLNAEIQNAESRIALSRSKALSHVNEIATSTATALVEHLVGKADHQTIASAVERAHVTGDDHVA